MACSVPKLKQTERRGGSERCVTLVRMRRLLIAIGGLGLIAVVVIGLAQTAGNNTKPKSSAFSQAEIERRLAGSPPALAAIHDQSNRLLPGGKQAFEARLKELRGHPVVVNLWAAWCGPCRAEFPVFQRQGVLQGKRVAFLAVDSEDNRGNATDFLKRFPVPYPSYEDGKGHVAIDYGVKGYPDTAFYDAAGKRVYVHQGPYHDEADLAKDIRRYALKR
jgi:cytochrome c biogenesis protein CcmG, thiol:disulfide interchange protein DsbE